MLCKPVWDTETYNDILYKARHFIYTWISMLLRHYPSFFPWYYYGITMVCSSSIIYTTSSFSTAQHPEHNATKTQWLQAGQAGQANGQVDRRRKKNQTVVYYYTTTVHYYTTTVRVHHTPLQSSWALAGLVLVGWFETIQPVCKHHTRCAH